MEKGENMKNLYEFLELFTECFNTLYGCFSKSPENTVQYLKSRALTEIPGLRTFSTTDAVLGAIGL